MSQRRDLESRLALYGDLSGILGAMRSFALAELRRVAQREAALQKGMEAMSQALDDMAPALPPPTEGQGDIRLLLGSARGFCASFNEDILRAWQEEPGEALATIVVGERLAALMPDMAERFVVPGAVGALDAAAAIDRILAAIGAIQEKNRSECGLVIYFRDEITVQAQRLLPISAALNRSKHELPFTYQPSARVAAGVAEHYLFHLLLSLLLRSLHAENHARLMQMENALQHIERNTEDLRRLRNQLRQEEIVEEIELIVGKKPKQR